MTLFSKGLRSAINYGLRRIDYVNPANKLVSKYAPPGSRNTLFKIVKASEALIGGKTAYDIYQLFADDSPGNASQIPYQKFYSPRKSYKTRSRRTVCYNRRNTSYSRSNSYR